MKLLKLLKKAPAPKKLRKIHIKPFSGKENPNIKTEESDEKDSEINTLRQQKMNQLRMPITPELLNSTSKQFTPKTPSKH